jgi:hypothetical protein
MMACSSRAGVAQLVERVLAKHKVDGSKPFTRSSEFLNQFNESSGIAKHRLAFSAVDCEHFCEDSASKLYPSRSPILFPAHRQRPASPPLPNV